MSEIVLQDEIDRKALEAMEGFSEIAGAGHFTPEQLLRVLGLLQTSLNGVLSSDVAGLFLEFMTESSEALRIAPSWLVTMTRIYDKPGADKMALTISGSTLTLKSCGAPSLSDFSRKFDLHEEAVAYAQRVHELMLSNGYRLLGKKK